MDWAGLLPDEQDPSYGAVRAIVEELRRDYLLWCEKVRDFEFATVHSSADAPNETAELLQDEVRALAVDIESYIAEINYLGVKLDVHQLFGTAP
jgi:hypothetical protein